MFYVYVKKGEYLWYNFSGDNPPKYVLDEDGNVTNMTPWLGGIASHYAKHDGIFEVHYEPFIDKNNQYASNTQYSWNVQAVSHDDKTIPGRVWANKVFIGQQESFNWNNPSTPHPNSIGDFSLTAVSPTGYQYQITAHEYGGIQSVITATSSGINKIVSENGQDYCKPTHKSYDNWYVSYGSDYDGYLPTGEESGYWVNHYRENYKCGQLYKLFFDTPAADLPKSIVPSLGVIPTPTVEVQSLYNKTQAVISNLDRLTTYTFSANGKETPLQGYETAIVNIDTNGPVQWTLKANSGNEIHLMLSDVKAGDMFYIDVYGETLAYEVTSIDVITPDQIEALAPVPGKDLVTLMTCTPYAVNSHRLLVTGERIPYTPATDPETEPAATTTTPGSVVEFVLNTIKTLPWYMRLMGTVSLGALVTGIVMVIPKKKHPRPQRDA